MAEDEQDIKEQDAQEEESKGKPAWLVWLIRSGIIILLLVAAFSLSKFVLYPIYKNSKTHAIQMETMAKMGDVYYLKDLTVNPMATNGRRFVVAEYALESRNPEVIRELKNREPQIRDEFIGYLRQRTATQILDIDFQETSKEDLTDIVNKLLYTGSVDSLYYTKLILQ